MTTPGFVLSAARRGVVALVAGIGVACRPAPPSAVNEAPASVPASVVDERYAAYNLPAFDAVWSVADYLRVRDALVKIEREQPDLLPRADGVGAPIFARWSSLEAMLAASESAGNMEAVFDLGGAAADVFKLYMGRVLQQEGFSREHLATAAVFLALQMVQSKTVIAAKALDVAALRADPVRLEGVQKLRQGLATVFLGVLAGPFEYPGHVDVGQCAEALAPVSADVTQYLLPEERMQARALVDRLALAGARPQDIETLRASFTDEQPRVDFVVGFLEEHRTFTQRQRELVLGAVAGLLLPIEVGPDPGGVRYAFPEDGAGFSAAFPEPPAAHRMAEKTTDGAEITIRTLTAKALSGVTRVVTCSMRPPRTPADTPQSLVDETIAGMKLGEVRDIEVDGIRGKEGAVGNARTRMLARVLGVGQAHCMIMVEYPTRLEREAASEARRFVESFRFGPFRG
jgi:hypothetical protein